MSASPFRRFFFDDGSSRKRWHVSVKAKTQIVQFGKLGGSLRESTKSFKTPNEATVATEKLIATKVREGYVEIDSSRLEIVRAKGAKKATEQQIRTFEKLVGCTLPDEYRNFLLTCNGGQPNPDCVRIPGMEGIDNVGVGSLFHLQPSKQGGDELTYQYQQASEILPKGHLPIAGSSDLFTLSLKPKTFGSVYWWFHETEELDDDEKFLESAGYLLAGSFEEFLTRIASLFDDELVDEPPPANTKGKNPKPTIKQLLRLIRHDHTPDKIKEIEQVVASLGDLSGIQDGQWPFANIRDAQLLRCLLKAGLNPEILDEERHSLLWLCACSAPCIDIMLKHDVNIERRSGGEAETPLMRAMFVEDIPAVKKLLEAGANPTVKLQWYISGNLDRNQELKKIVEKARQNWKPGKSTKNSSKQTKSKTKATTAEVAKNKPKPTLNRLLRTMKQDYFPEEFDGIEEIEELIADLGDLSGIQDGEWPAIYKFESPRLLKCLLDHGLNPEITDKKGNSLLWQCVSHPKSISLLLKKGVEVNRHCNDEETALMRATYHAEEDSVKMLLKAGANPTIPDKSFARAMLNMDEEMNKLIESAQRKWKG